MPEIPDPTIYLEHLEARCVERVLERIPIASPTLPRSLEELEERQHGA